MAGNLRFVRRALGLVLLIFSSGILLWGVWQFPQESASIPIPPDHRMELLWPGITRVGDARSVRMQIEPESAGEVGASPAALQASEQRSNEMAAARLEFSGLQFFPADLVSQPLLPGTHLTFRWQFRPESRGDFTGVAWLYLLDVPRDGSPESAKPVSAREISIRTVDLFGLSGPLSRSLGIVGIVLGGLLGLDGVLTWLQKRLRRQGSFHQAPELAEQ